MWLESHANLARHPKTRRLMKRLGWSLPDTIGNLHLFWYWALDFAPTGNLTPYTPEQLTADLDLLGATPEQFLEAMIAAGFLDKEEGGVLCIHDWPEYKRPKPRRKSAGSSRPAEAGTTSPLLPASQSRSAKAEHDLNQVVPPRRDPAVPRIPALDSAAPTEEQPAQEQQEPRQPSTTFTRHTSSSDVGEADVHLATQPHELRTNASIEGVSPTASAPLSETPPHVENQELRKEIPANLWRLPGFAKHWWPLYIEFHKKAGTPLTKEAEAKFLAQLAQNPLSAVQQIKDNITRAVRTDFTERDTALPRNSFRPAIAGHDHQLVVPPRRDAVRHIKAGITHAVRSGILEHAP